MYDQLSEIDQEYHTDHTVSDLQSDEISTLKTFHLQPRTDVVPDSPASLDSSSGLVARQDNYPQGPGAGITGSQLLLLPILAMWLRSFWAAYGTAGRTTGSHHRRSIGHDGARRQHARSWNISNLTQESLD